jgi:hypothetical protein
MPAWRPEGVLVVMLGLGLGAGCGGSSQDGDGRGAGASGGSSVTGGTSGSAGHARGGSAGIASGAGGATTGGASGAGGAHAGTGGMHAGAGGQAGGVAGSSAGAPDQATAEYRACATYMKARCARLYECGSGYVDSCESYELDLCPDFVFGPGSNNTIELIQGCADLWKDAPCSVLQTFTAVCHYAPGQFANGEACTAPWQCESGTCTGSDTFCGSCVPELEPGAPCAGGEGECAYGTTCDGTTCVPRPPIVIDAGDDCDTGYVNCYRGYTCRNDDAGKPKCLPPLETGGACASSYDCLRYNYCDSATHVCTPSPPAGMPCAGNGIGACDAASLCDTRTMPLMCVPLVARGETCFDRPNLTDPYGNCADGLFCVCDAGEDCNDGICMQRVLEGESCDEADTLCIPGTACRAGKCQVSGSQGSFAEACMK